MFFQEIRRFFDRVNSESAKCIYDFFAPCNDYAPAVRKRMCIFPVIWGSFVIFGITANHFSWTGFCFFDKKRNFCAVVLIVCIKLKDMCVTCVFGVNRSRFKSRSYTAAKLYSPAKNAATFSCVAFCIKCTAQINCTSLSLKRLTSVFRCSSFRKNAPSSSINLGLLYGVCTSPRYIRINSKKCASGSVAKLSRQLMMS